MPTPPPTEQLALLRSATRGKKPKPPEATAVDRPIARVLVDVPLPHLDRPFDYTVPESMAEAAVPGARVRVRFAGQDVEGFVLERADVTEHEGRLSRITRSVSAEPVLTPAVAGLAKAVADRYAGSMLDVVRLAVPPRHARVEKEAPGEPEAPPLIPEPTEWSRYPAGPALLARITDGGAPRAVWTALPGASHWPAALAQAITAALAGGRGALAVLPDGRDVAALDAALSAALGPGRHVTLTADLGPAARYRAFLKLERGEVKAAIGTRAAAFAPVKDLGLVAIWDDGDDNHQEPRAPYPHAREVLAIRSEREGTALIAGSWSRTAESTAWIAAGWARPVQADRAVVRKAWPQIAVAGGEPGDDDPAARGRLPAPVWRALRAGLREGPVLVQVPRAGYLPAMACLTCRTPSRCLHCHGPLSIPGAGMGEQPACRWCGRDATGWVCPVCGGRRMRATSVGVQRTAEELGRAFTGVPVVVPVAGRPSPVVPAGALVVSTPGLEPAAEGGYAAAVLLDAQRLLERADLRGGEDALRRWLAACALVRPWDGGGRAVIDADPTSPAVQALVRIDPAGHAERDLAERTELGFPPAVAMVALAGPPAAVQALADSLAGAGRLPAGTEPLGPIPLEGSTDVRLLLRAPRRAGAQLADEVAAAVAVRSAKREPAVRIQVDPDRIG